MQSPTPNILKLHHQAPAISPYTLNNMSFVAYKGVFNPAIAHSGKLDSYFTRLPIFHDKTVLDMGCGSGAVSCLTKLAGASRVVAVDINPLAIQNAQYNVGRYGLNKYISCRRGYLFAPITPHEKFDVIFANLPFAEGATHTMLDKAFYDPRLASLRTVIIEAPRYLAPTGSAYICIANITDTAILQSTAIQNRLHWRVCTTLRQGQMTLSLIRLYR
jgi:methylase of polypeptide subunit release factors